VSCLSSRRQSQTRLSYRHNSLNVEHQSPALLGDMCHTTQNVATHLCILPPPPRAKDSEQTSFSHNKHTTATCTRAIRRGLSAHIPWSSRPSIPLSSHWCEEACPKASFEEPWISSLLSVCKSWETRSERGSSKWGRIPHAKYS